MKKSKIESNAKIFNLSTKRKKKEHDSPSEVARSLFSETWRSYLDEVNMVAVKKKKEKETKIDNSKSPVRLFLID